MITLSEQEYDALKEQAAQLSKVSDKLAQTQSILHDIADGGRALIWMSGADQKYYFFNKAWQQFTGKSLDELSGFGWIENVYSEDISNCISTYRKAFTARNPFEVVFRLRRHDGEYRWIITQGAPRFKNDQFVGFIGHCLDFTEQKQTEILEQTRSEALSQVATGMPLKFILNTIVTGIEKAKPEALCSIQLIDQDTGKLRNGAAPSLPEFYNAMVEKLTIGLGVGCCGTAAVTGEIVIAEDINIHPYWQDYLEVTRAAGLASCWSAPIFSSKGDILGTFAIYHAEPHCPATDDFTIIRQAAELAGIAIDRARDTEQLNILATTDYLTGLANRRLFYQRLEAEISRVQRQLHPASLLMLDLDHFKDINDQFGHAAGDTALKTFSDIIRHRLRETDVAARVGGEEFAVLLAGADIAAAKRFAESLRDAVENTQLHVGDMLCIKLTVSIGIAEITAQSNAEFTMNRADQALYRAKHTGRNRVCDLADANDVA